MSCRDSKRSLPLTSDLKSGSQTRSVSAASSGTASPKPKVCKDMKPQVKVYGWVIGIILLLWFYTFALYAHDLVTGGSSQFGAIFGALNTLFSGLAFAFVIIALLQQQKQFEQQAFEATFFKLLELFRENAQLLQAPNGPEKTFRGKQVLAHKKSWLEKNLTQIKPEPNGKFSDASVKEVAVKFYKDHEYRLGDYFRILFHLLQHIRDAKCLTESKKQHFANLVRALLDKNEVFLLCFDGIQLESEAGMKRLISQFDMIKYLELGSLESHINIERFYTHLRTGE